MVALGNSTCLQPPLDFDERMTMFKLINAVCLCPVFSFLSPSDASVCPDSQLFHFLRVDYAPYHVRAVHLVWMLENATTNHHVESIVAQSLTSLESRDFHEAYETFGVLWRLTGSHLHTRMCGHLGNSYLTSFRQMMRCRLGSDSRLQCLLSSTRSKTTIQVYVVLAKRGCAVVLGHIHGE